MPGQQSDGADIEDDFSPAAFSESGRPWVASSTVHGGAICEPPPDIGAGVIEFPSQVCQDGGVERPCVLAGGCGRGGVWGETDKDRGTVPDRLTPEEICDLCAFVVAVCLFALSMSGVMVANMGDCVR